jgi:hypothetical protein
MRVPSEVLDDEREKLERADWGARKIRCAREHVVLHVKCCLEGIDKHVDERECRWEELTGGKDEEGSNDVVEGEGARDGEGVIERLGHRSIMEVSESSCAS